MGLCQSQKAIDPEMQRFQVLLRDRVKEYAVYMWSITLPQQRRLRRGCVRCQLPEVSGHHMRA
jgi:hypothetical protein